MSCKSLRHSSLQREECIFLCEGWPGPVLEQVVTVQAGGPGSNLQWASLCFSSAVSPLIIKEWAAYKGKSPKTPELVEALAFREWTCPNLKRLWLGKAVEDKNRRMRAFLACMRSDTPAMLNPANVPTHLMVLCCVLRWVTWGRGIVTMVSVPWKRWQAYFTRLCCLLRFVLDLCLYV